MGCDIKVLAINALRRHTGASTQSQPSQTCETAVRLPEASSGRASQPQPEQPKSYDPPENIDLALRIAGYLETLPAHQSATASEIAEVFHGRQYTLNHVIEVYHICEELRGRRSLSEAGMATATSFRIHLKALHDEGFRASLFPLRAVWPVFADGEEGSDFNDLAALVGTDTVREHLLATLEM